MQCQFQDLTLKGGGRSKSKSFFACFGPFSIKIRLKVNRERSKRNRRTFSVSRHKKHIGPRPLEGGAPPPLDPLVSCDGLWFSDNNFYENRRTYLIAIRGSFIKFPDWDFEVTHLAVQERKI